jgi:hypothetical protein
MVVAKITVTVTVEAFATIELCISDEIIRYATGTHLPDVHVISGRTQRDGKPANDTLRRGIPGVHISGYDNPHSVAQLTEGPGKSPQYVG